MKYLLQIDPVRAIEEFERPAEDEQHAIVEEYLAIGQSPGVVGGDQLQPVETATTVAGHDTVAQAATHGYQRALTVGAGFVLAGAVVAMLAPNGSRSEPAIEEEPALDLAAWAGGAARRSARAASRLIPRQVTSRRATSRAPAPRKTAT